MCLGCFIMWELSIKLERNVHRWEACHQSKTKLQAMLSEHWASEEKEPYRERRHRAWNPAASPNPHYSPSSKSIREKPALNLNLYLAAFHNNYCITWHRGHGPTWTRRALGERGGELGMPFSHTSLQNQFSSPKWQTENTRRNEKLLPFAGSSSVLNTTWSQQLLAIQDTAFCISAQKRISSLEETAINFVQNINTFPPEFIST